MDPTSLAHTVHGRRAALVTLGSGTGAVLLSGPLFSAAAGAADVCLEIPEETAGPYPGDGSNGPNVLTQSGVVRSDIRSSFGSFSGTAAGITSTLELTVLDVDTCSPLVGAAIYLWHCDRDGRYSLYSTGVTNQNYLRGVQVTDSAGKVTFTTIFPATYSGRWPHIHFEVYPSLAAISSASNKIATSQFALPDAACAAVYATSGYETSLTNFSRVSLATDNVFADGYARQLVTATGSPAVGYTLGAVASVSGGSSTPVAGTIAAATSIDGILAASDYSESYAAVLRLYRAFFRREPDVAGAKYWLAIARNGSTLDDIAWAFANSTEFAQIYGTTDDTQFVTIVYSNVLGRTPDAAGLAYWLGMVTSGRLSRHGVVRWIAASAEFTTLYPYAPR